MHVRSTIVKLLWIYSYVASLREPCTQINTFLFFYLKCLYMAFQWQMVTKAVQKINLKLHLKKNGRRGVSEEQEHLKLFRRKGMSIISFPNLPLLSPLHSTWCNEWLLLCMGNRRASCKGAITCLPPSVGNSCWLSGSCSGGEASQER